MPVVKTTCPRRDRTGEITYTGVDPNGELRECPDCSGEVAVDPRCDEVLHVESE
ncbi:hypothetical protein [Candidatus Halobonum tyrrellensis]|uniref:Uncharacterized protein n=1 Tax=Candidatus Halobonum tyrrellensis G22 TaxID=1324957 RepID=V4GTE9_9EURY|nr:hypothetical protein [Candidatus Halobonum tyrrellensis]ESP88366.1 hypothetical protein K933_09592 [Candidatus Halobonum tyrrellensis G22]